MNMIRQLANTVVAGAATLMVFSASANNGIERYPVYLPPNPGFWVACLNEYVAISSTIFAAYHEFDTPSGKFHFFERWDYEWEITGLSSQDTWFARGSWAETRSFGPGVIVQWTENILALPVTGSGPKLRMHLRFKTTVNANGDLVVLHDDYDWSQAAYFFECFGKPQ